MIRLSLREIARIVGGTLQGEGERMVTGVSTDSRRIDPDNLFIAIRGERFDGHDFVHDLTGRAAAALVSREWFEQHPAPLTLPVVVVPDTLTALGDLAGGWRERFPIPVIGVTGSNGKTTVKEMTAAILSGIGPGCATTGNLNNLVGLPLMLLTLSEEHRWGVLEMGMSEPGEIDRLAAIARPRIGVITNANPSHLASMESVENVARAKGELFLRLPAGGVAIYCAEDERLRNLPVPAGVERIGYGIDQGEVRGASIESLGAGGSRFWIELPGCRVRVTLPVPGRHTVLNALAAATAAWVAGAGADMIAEGLGRFTGYQQRFVIIPGRGVTIVDDTYNANPASMAAALKTLAGCAAGSFRTAILGEMRELGKDEIPLHREVGRMAAPLLHRLIVVGGLGEEIARGAREGGMGEESVIVAESGEEAARVVIDGHREGEWVLVKGSRGMRMETVVNRLRERFCPPDGGGA